MSLLVSRVPSGAKNSNGGSRGAGGLVDVGLGDVPPPDDPPPEEPPPYVNGGEVRVSTRYLFRTQEAPPLPAT